MSGRDPVEMQAASVRARRRNKAKSLGPLAWTQRQDKKFERPDWWDK